MAKIRKIFRKSNNMVVGHVFMFMCPGCKRGHVFNQKGGVMWTFNGDMEKPTISPSYLTGIDNFTKVRCHSFIKEGKIQFLADCYHELKGQTVELPDIDEEYVKG